MSEGVRRGDRLKGARFGQHEIVELIGHGATASVFKALHVALGKSVAVKVLHEHLASNEQLAGRFVLEGRIAAKLHHPNAIDVLDVGVEDGVPYLVTELLHGVDLRALLADAAPLSVEHALAFLLPIASALQHAHDAGVLHRDLKPANIFLSRDVRDDVVPKLLDFGLSKMAADDSQGSLTQSGLVAGTVLYMAPEQTLGVRNASPVSDQYSLAAVLYECVTGVPAFSAEGTLYDVIERVRTATPPAPSAVRASLPTSLDAIIARGMERDPKARYPDVRSFARDLLPLADDATSRALDRDFLDRPSGGGSRPSIRRADVRSGSPTLETRAEISAAAAARGDAPLPCPPGASPFHIKGVFYRGFIRNMEAAVGMDPFSAALPDDALRAFAHQPFLASGRYDLLPFVPLTHALATLLGVRFDALVRTSTVAQARYDAQHAYKLIFDLQKPEDVATRIERFNTQVFDFGTYKGLVPEPKHIALDYSFIPAYLEPWFSPMHVAYAEETLRLCGATDLVVLSRLVEDAGMRDTFPLVRFRTQLRWK